MDSSIKSQPVLFFIFGGTGDLNKRKITPALYNLFLDNWLPEKFAIIGNGRSELTDTAYRKKLLEGTNEFSRKGIVVKKQWDEFASKIFYQSANVSDDKSYKHFKEKIEKYETEWKQKPVIIYYLAVSPNLFPIIGEHIAKNNLAEESDYTRIVIEKPFGHDLESAKSLNELLATIFDEKQIYRIDHYLGKEAVQNILAFRFSNAILEPIWNRNYIDHVQISVSEKLGVEERGEYYETAGALRDMIQNHLLQLVCLIAMETPINFSADEVRNRKVDVLRAMRRFKPEEIKKVAVRGQYGPGWVEGKQVPGYRDENDVDPNSNTETFAAIKFFVDNWRWHDVPFYVRTGKRMHQTASVISIQFRDVPHCVFPADSTDNWQQNRLIISIQPEMSIRLQVQAKRPGLEMVLNPVDMIFKYEEATETPEAYETLLLDIITGDQTLFMRADQVEFAWDLLMPLLNSWDSKKSLSFPNYSADSQGPEIAEALIAQDGFHWFTLPIKNKL
ncbi:glucose-6-phosphate dehydrogenase [Flavobacterium sp. TAB 87]|uniref:glucose-6-phosphate dehydrogenase n=1 Tax=Flavobacterium sp. TAB 87 TaxID=1729581 RepID=UPI00076DD467|nr:glucose-6-phosphate dehydrogenase [Flavobacterium sp. TAB 87]KVV16179.1 Glucose-6-phosphate 1-dehydrogenase [Flavobacterium sp. TAB 87]